MHSRVSTKSAKVASLMKMNLQRSKDDTLGNADCSASLRALLKMRCKNENARKELKTTARTAIRQRTNEEEDDDDDDDGNEGKGVKQRDAGL